MSLEALGIKIHSVAEYVRGVASGKKLIET